MQLPTPSVFARLHALIRTTGLIAGWAAQTATAMAALPCSPQSAVNVEAIEAQIVVIGEMHGTEQAPRFVSGLMCSLLQAGHGVIVALERDAYEQGALNDFVASAGQAADRDALWRHRDWRSPTQDGRNSSAMMALIEEVRRLRAAGQRVGILALQQPSSELAPQRQDELTPLDERDVTLYSRVNDRSMANALLVTGALYGRYKIVALVGGTHASSRAHTWAEPGHLPMGALVIAERPAFFIGLRTSGGTVWGSNGRIRSGVREIDAGSFTAPGARVDAEVDLGPVTASPPARPNR